MEKFLKFACALLLSATFQAQAAIVHLPGDTVDFYYDDAQPGYAVYGSLTVVGDSIFAQPTLFKAEALNGANADASALGTVTVVAKSGYDFDAVLVAQQGDYQMAGAGPTVSATAELTVDSNTSAASNVSTLTSSSDFTVKGALTEWSSSTQVDLSTAEWDGVMGIDLTLDSIIAATTASNGESALIQNKFVGGGMVTIETSPVPLPASLWLLLSGMAGLVGLSRRKVRNQ